MDQPSAEDSPQNILCVCICVGGGGGGGGRKTDFTRNTFHFSNYAFSFHSAINVERVCGS